MNQATFPLEFMDGCTVTDRCQPGLVGHEQLCLGWCHEGTGTLAVAGRLFNFKPRTLMLFAPHEHYYACSTRGNISIWSFISIDMPTLLRGQVPEQQLLAMDDLRGPRFNHVLNERSERALCKLVSQMVGELRLKQGDYQEALRRLCKTLAVLLKRLSGRLTDEDAVYIWKTQMQLLQPALAMIAAHSAADPRLEDLAAACKLGLSQFNQQFYQSIGCSARDFMLRSRLHYAADMLHNAQYSIEEIAAHAGFIDQKVFEQIFEGHFGETAQAWRKRPS